MKINHNIPALRTINSMNKTNASAAKTMERLSSGLRINSAADDSAGMAIANKMDAQIRGLRQANRNVMDGISMVQTAEGALNEVSDMLSRMKELAVQAANDTYEKEDKDTIQDEIDALLEEIQAIQKNTQFNNKNLLDGSQPKFDLQIGANEGQQLTIDGTEMNLDKVLNELGGAGFKITDPDAITKIDKAQEANSKIRSKLGAYQNRLEHTANNLGVSEENMTSSLSRIQDADMAEEMAEYTRFNILSQASTSMLAQANQRPQQILQLLQG